MKLKFISVLLLALAGVTSKTTFADEGMWQPHQLPELSDKLVEMGLELDPENLNSLTAFPMNAIVSLGGCSAAFVSPKGLVLTNHHCIYGSIQYNSTEENNLLELGFLAKQLSEEIQAAPGARVYVTEEVTKVSDRVLEGVSDAMSGLDRYESIEANMKAIVADCEKTKIHRCRVAPFHQGLEYFLIKQLEIRDVRLVYAPANSVGRYGGDIDNWMWPRHTGDFGFYRAYVGKDGNPADYSEDNVPYQAQSHLKISAKGVEQGDFVMAMGYPGKTDRYRTAAEVENEFNWYYPEARKIREDLMAIIDSEAEPGSQARINYESTYSRLSNYAKNFKSMVESYSKTDLLARKQKQETDLALWIASDSNRKNKYGRSLEQLSALINETHQTQARDLVLAYMYYTALPDAATDLYRLAVEKQKPDAERKPGFQNRDMTKFKQAIQRVSRRYDPNIEKAMLLYLLERYAEIPSEQRIPALDKSFAIGEAFDKKKVQKRVDAIYKKTQLDDEDTRLAWMDKSIEEFESSRDPLIQFAVAMHEPKLEIENQDKENTGLQQLWRSRYMEAVIAYNRSLGLPIYADANSTLRVTFGQVKGNMPRDSLVNMPFTTLEGIPEKDTGITPFDAPAKQLELIKKKHYGKYKLESIASVPVNYLTTVDITGGNSGSATLNGKAEIVGLLFDGVYESIIGDWDFNPEKNRAISVDSRYMLWVMEYLDGASNLIEEMDIVD
jgi:hypothetical protein